MTALSETGLCRQNNQDSVLAVYKNNVGIFAVADGMGGLYRGELASQKVVSYLGNWWKRIQNGISSISFGDIVSDLEKKIKEINEDIIQMYEKMGEKGGTTLCLLFIYGNAYAVFNIGDSRLYKCQGRHCIQITSDDLWENQSQIRKNLGKEEINQSPSCGRLVQAVGVNHQLCLPIITGIIEKRTCFFLCSDGIYKYMENKWFSSQLKRIKRDKDIDTVIERIRKKIYDNGAGDNLSLILVLAEKNRKGQKNEKE